MEYTNSKSHNRDVTDFVEWMKSELRRKASQKSELYNFDFLSDSTPKRSCKRLSWGNLTHQLPTDDSSTQNPFPGMKVLNS